LTINFYLKKSRVNKEGKSPVVARITLNGKRLEISTGKSIEDSRWNTAKGVAKGIKEDVARLNSFLSNFHAKIADVYVGISGKVSTDSAFKLTPRFAPIYPLHFGSK
jgi:hypothetical protein